MSRILGLFCLQTATRSCTGIMDRSSSCFRICPASQESAFYWFEVSWLCCSASQTCHAFMLLVQSSFIGQVAFLQSVQHIVLYCSALPFLAGACSPPGLGPIPVLPRMRESRESWTSRLRNFLGKNFAILDSPIVESFKIGLSSSSPMLLNR